GNNMQRKSGILSHDRADTITSVVWRSGQRSLPNRGTRDGQGQQLAGQGEEEAEEGREGGTGEIDPAAEEEVTRRPPRPIPSAARPDGYAKSQTALSDCSQPRESVSSL